MVTWDATKMRATKKEVLVEGRLVRVELEVIGTPKRLMMLGAYMPNRGSAKEEVEPVWDELILEATAGGKDTLVVGDLNAELRGRVEARGARMTLADRKLETMT